MRTFMAKEARWIGQKWTTKSIGVTHVRVEQPDEPAKSTTKYRPPGDTERIKPRSRIGRDDHSGSRRVSALPLQHRLWACPAGGNPELQAGRQLAVTEVPGRRVDRDGRRGKAVRKPASKDRGRSAGPQAEAPMRLGGSMERAGDSYESRPRTMKKTTTKPSPRVAALEKKPNASSEMMTVLQVAEYLVVNPETIYLLLKNRRIPGFKVSSGWRFRRSDIDQWISDRQMKPRPCGSGYRL